jgi:hypothetical protein
MLGATEDRSQKTEVRSQNPQTPNFELPPIPNGHGSLRLVEPLPALPTVFVPVFCLSRFHLPASLGSTGITPLLGYYGGSVTFRARFFGPSTDHERRSFPGS